MRLRTKARFENSRRPGSMGAAFKNDVADGHLMQASGSMKIFGADFCGECHLRK